MKLKNLTLLSLLASSLAITGCNSGGSGGWQPSAGDYGDITLQAASVVNINGNVIITANVSTGIDTAVINFTASNSNVILNPASCTVQNASCYTVAYGVESGPVTITATSSYEYNPGTIGINVVESGTQN